MLVVVMSFAYVSYIYMSLIHWQIPSNHKCNCSQNGQTQNQFLSTLSSGVLILFSSQDCCSVFSGPRIGSYYHPGNSFHFSPLLCLLFPWSVISLLDYAVVLTEYLLTSFMGKGGLGSKFFENLNVTNVIWRRHDW